MKQFAKIIALVAVLAIGGNLSAQVFIGAFGNGMVLKTEGQNDQTYTGFSAGITTNMALSRHTGIGFGAYYNRLWKDDVKDAAGIKFHNKYVEQSVSVPVVVNVRIYLSELTYIYPFIGPNFKIGISAIREQWMDNSENRLKIDYYNDKDIYADKELNRYNIDLMFGVGAKIDFINIVAGVTGDLFNRRYKSEVSEKAYHAFLGAGFVF